MPRAASTQILQPTIMAHSHASNHDIDHVSNVMYVPTSTDAQKDASACEFSCLKIPVKTGVHARVGMRVAVRCNTAVLLSGFVALQHVCVPHHGTSRRDTRTHFSAFTGGGSSHSAFLRPSSQTRNDLSKYGSVFAERSNGGSKQSTQALSGSEDDTPLTRNVPPTRVSSLAIVRCSFLVHTTST